MISVRWRTGRNELEFCEIEEKGGLIVDRGTCLYAPGGRQACGYVLTYTQTGFDFVEKSMDELRQSEGTCEGA